MSWQRIGKGGTKYWGHKGAGIFFTDGTAVLLLKRAAPSDREDSWTIPGGKTEDGETNIGAAIRETKEETGITAIPGVQFASFESKDGQHRFVTYLYKVKSPFDVTISKEHSDWKWVPFKSLLSNDLYLHPRLRDMLPEILKAVRKNCDISFDEWCTLRGFEQ